MSEVNSPCGEAFVTTFCQGTFGYRGYCFMTVSGCKAFYMVRSDTLSITVFQCAYRFRSDLSKRPVVWRTHKLHNMQQLILVIPTSK
jgi:hypothetical protein